MMKKITPPLGKKYWLESLHNDNLNQPKKEKYLPKQTNERRFSLPKTLSTSIINRAIRSPSLHL